MSARHRLLLPVTAVVLGLTACASTPAAAPAPVAPPVSAAPVSSSSAPTSVTPSATAPTSVKVKTEPSQRTANCPSAKALEKLAELPEDWRFIPSSVECWQDWATADPEGPSDGDGIYLFRYRAGKGWTYHSQGSGYHCAELGIREPAPFCQYP